MGSPPSSHINGFTAIPNDLLEGLASISLTDYESRCLHYLIRKTYGWNKKADAISYRQWCDATRIGSRRNVVRTLSRLVDRKIVVKEVVATSGKNILAIWRVAENITPWVGVKEPPLTVQVGVTEPLVTVQVGVKEPPEVGVKEPPLTVQVGVAKTPLPVQVGAFQTKVLSVQTPEVLSVQTPTKEKKDNTKEKNHALGPTGTQGAAFAEPRKKVFEELKKRRGYPSPHAGAEASAITWMLKQGYSVDQIMTAHDNLKEQSFWVEKFLGMQSVKAQIGEIVKGGHKEVKHHGGGFKVPKPDGASKPVKSLDADGPEEGEG